ncbi:O-antigen ligase family protein [Candidatus Peregrinibacteria bacterium]|nr:MAG: O-antigen ligase family protein [Candidatus Peregrinibacteria bacterium]
MQSTKSFDTIIALSPLLFAAYFWRFSIFGIPTTVLEVFVYGLLGGWLLLWVIAKRPLRWNATLRWMLGGALFIVAGALIGLIASPATFDLPSGELLNAKRVGAGIFKGWVLTPVVYFWVLTQMIDSAKKAERLLKWFVYSAALIVLIGFIMMAWGHGFTYDHRFSAFFESANQLALYLVPATLLNAYFVFHEVHDHKKEQWFDILLLVFLSVGLFLTQSYAAMLAAFGSLTLYGLYYWYTHKRESKIISLALAALFFTFALALVSQMNTPKFKQFLDFENRSSTTVRLEIYQTSLHLIKEHPFTGIGPGLFQANYQTNVENVLNENRPETEEHRYPLEWNMPHAHNIFLGFWLNAGLLGLIGFLLVLAWSHRKFTYPLIALWGIVAHGLFDMPFWKNDLAMIFWMLMACIIVLQTHETRTA